MENLNLTLNLPVVSENNGLKRTLRDNRHSNHALLELQQELRYFKQLEPSTFEPVKVSHSNKITEVNAVHGLTDVFQRNETFSLMNTKVKSVWQSTIQHRNKLRKIFTAKNNIEVAQAVDKIKSKILPLTLRSKSIDSTEQASFSMVRLLNSIKPDTHSAKEFLLSLSKRSPDALISHMKSCELVEEADSEVTVTPHILGQVGNPGPMSSEFGLQLSENKYIPKDQELSQQNSETEGNTKISTGCNNKLFESNEKNEKNFKCTSRAASVEIARRIAAPACLLCNEGDHGSEDCKKYKNLDEESWTKKATSFKKNPEKTYKYNRINNSWFDVDRTRQIEKAKSNQDHDKPTYSVTADCLAAKTAQTLNRKGSTGKEFVPQCLFKCQKSEDYRTSNHRSHKSEILRKEGWIAMLKKRNSEYCVPRSDEQMNQLFDSVLADAKKNSGDFEPLVLKLVHGNNHDDFFHQFSLDLDCMMILTQEVDRTADSNDVISVSPPKRSKDQNPKVSPPENVNKENQANIITPTEFIQKADRGILQPNLCSNLVVPRRDKLKNSKCQQLKIQK